ncbi:MAG: aldo/keto reductase [Zoogloeaceae bacterium]|jgi:2,5-diketo-D-gluconate reductase A|nr:aldo/keto reductase [Zoogloeaceae bacterium]
MARQTFLTLDNGATIPQLGLGTWQTPEPEAASVIQTALAAGYRLIDTAAIYNNETGVGRGLEAGMAALELARGAVFITTKLWNDRQGFDSTLRACDESLARLGLDYVDLYLIHWPAPRQNRYLESWQALIRLREEGKARAIGVSNFEAAHLERIIGETGVVPAVNQIELHPDFQQKPLRAVHARHGILTQSWSPLGQGNLLQQPQISAIARKHGKTAAQIILRWHLEEGLLVIPKSGHAERIASNFAVFDFVLDAEDRKTLAALDNAKGRLGPHPDRADF